MNLNLSSSYYNSTRRLHNQTATDIGTERQNDDQSCASPNQTITDRRKILLSRPTYSGILDPDSTNNDHITPRDDHSDHSGIGSRTFSKPLLGSDRSSLIIRDFKKATTSSKTTAGIPKMNHDVFGKSQEASSSPKGFERLINRFPITDVGAQTSRRNSGFKFNPEGILAQRKEQIVSEHSGSEQASSDPSEMSDISSDVDYIEHNDQGGNMLSGKASLLAGLGNGDGEENMNPRKNFDKLKLKLNLGTRVSNLMNNAEEETPKYGAVQEEKANQDDNLNLSLGAREKRKQNNNENMNTFGNEFLQSARLELNSPTLRIGLEEFQGQNPLEPAGQGQELSAIVENNQSHHELVLYSQLEAELFLKGRISIFITMNLVSAFSLLHSMNKISSLPIFITLYCYFLYYIINSIKRAKIPERSPWREAEEWFNVLQGICGAFFLVYIHLDFLAHYRLSIIGPYALLIHAVLYCIRSPAPNNTKLARLVRAAFYTLQAFLITCQLDGFVKWDWRLAFMFTWLYCGVIVLYFISFALLIVMLTIFTIFKQNLEHNMSTSTEFLGLFWHLLYYGQSLVALLVVYGIGEAYSSANPSLYHLQLGAMMGISVSGLLSLFTIFGFKRLTLFIQFFNSTTASVSHDGTVAIVPKREIKFDVHKKESYFVMLSPTYFLPFDSTVRAHNQENLQKVRSVLKKLKLLSPQQKGRDTQRNSKSHIVVDVNVLKQYKEDLDEKFNGNNLTKRASLISSISPRRDGVSRQNTVDGVTARAGLHDSMIAPQEQKSKDPTGMAKLCLSDGDMDKFSDAQSEPRTTKNGDENLCYLCYSDAPNAVFMKCGHGGICYECATMLIKKKNECMQCRSPVEMIYKIDPNSKTKNVIKGIEFTKVNEIIEV